MDEADTSEGAGVKKTSEPPERLRGKKDRAVGLSMPLPVLAPIPLLPPGVSKRQSLRARTFGRGATCTHRRSPHTVWVEEADLNETFTIALREHT